MAEKFGEIKKPEAENERKPRYTLEDFEKERNWDSGFGPNNPNAVKRAYSNHLRRLKEIKDYLIGEGLLKQEEPKITEEEKISEELDRLYPNAKSKSIVEYKGEKYQIHYFPLSKSRSGKTVHEWGHSWNLYHKKET